MEEDDYFAMKVQELQKDLSYSNLCRTIWNVFSPLTFCKHVFSIHDYEDFKLQGGLVPAGTVINAIDGRAILSGDWVYVEMDQLDYFIKDIFPSIDTRFVLITGGFFLRVWNHPTTWDSEEVPRGLKDCVDSSKVIAWGCKNAIDNHHPKCIPIPIGVFPLALPAYASALVESVNHQFQTRIPQMAELFMGANSMLRQSLVSTMSKRQSPEEYFRTVIKYQALCSPTGVRADCFRHLEAIGLGTLPIANTYLEISQQPVAEVLDPLYGSSLAYCDTIENARNLKTFLQPDRNLLWTDTWIERISQRVKQLSAAESDTHPK